MAEQLHPEDIYQTLEHDIVTLKIKPGETISENQLCKRFGISRTPVRAALQRLEQNGFVQIIPCKGTIVTPINLDIVDQIAYQRTAVESMVLRDFIQVCSPKEYIEIKHKYDLLEEMAQTMTDPENVDINAFLMLDLEMHAIWFCSMNKWYIWQSLTKPDQAAAGLFPLHPSGCGAGQQCAGCAQRAPGDPARDPGKGCGRH